MWSLTKLKKKKKKIVEVGMLGKLYKARRV